MDRLLDTLQLVVDRQAAIPLWKEYQLLLLREQPYTYFYFPERLDGINKRVRDVTMDARGEWVNIKDWWIPRDKRRAAQRAAAR
jgi:ABC-type transport system substrate-binding protein